MSGAVEQTVLPPTLSSYVEALTSKEMDLWDEALVGGIFKLRWGHEDGVFMTGLLSLKERLLSASSTAWCCGGRSLQEVSQQHLTAMAPWSHTSNLQNW